MAGADFELLAQLTKDEEQLVKRLENLMERWAYLEEIVEGQS